jgi:hypothetical protein
MSRLMAIISLTVLCVTAQAGLLETSKRTQRRNAQRILGFIPSETHILFAAKAPSTETTYAALMLLPEACTKEEMHSWARDGDFARADESGKVLYAARKRLEYVLSQNLAEGEELPDKEILKAWVREIWDGGLNNLGQWQGDGFRTQALEFAAQKKAEVEAAALTPLRLGAPGAADDAATEEGSDGEGSRGTETPDGLSVVETPLGLIGAATPMTPMTPAPQTPATNQLKALDIEEAARIEQANTKYAKLQPASRDKAIKAILEREFAPRRAALEVQAIAEIQERLVDQARATAASLAMEIAAIDRDAEAAVAPLGDQEDAAIQDIIATLADDADSLGEVAEEIQAQETTAIRAQFDLRRAEIRAPFEQHRDALEARIREVLAAPQRTAAVTGWLGMKAAVEGGTVRMSIVDASKANKDPVLQFYVLGRYSLADLWADSKLPEEKRALFKRSFISAPETYHPTASPAAVAKSEFLLARKDQVVRSLYGKFMEAPEPNPRVFHSTIFNALVQHAMFAWDLTPAAIGDLVNRTSWDVLLSGQDVFRTAPEGPTKDAGTIDESEETWDAETCARAAGLIDVLGQENLNLPIRVRLIEAAAKAHGRSAKDIADILYAHTLGAVIENPDLFTTSELVGRRDAEPVRCGAGSSTVDVWAIGCYGKGAPRDVLNLFPTKPLRAPSFAAGRYDEDNPTPVAAGLGAAGATLYPHEAATLGAARGTMLPPDDLTRI